MPLQKTNLLKMVQDLLAILSSHPTHPSSKLESIWSNTVPKLVGIDLPPASPTLHCGYGLLPFSDFSPLLSFLVN